MALTIPSARRVLQRQVNASAATSNPLPPKPIVTAPKRTATRQLASTQTTAVPVAQVTQNKGTSNSGEDSDEYVGEDDMETSDEDIEDDEEDDLGDLEVYEVSSPSLYTFPISSDSYLAQRPTWVTGAANGDEEASFTDLVDIPDVPRSQSPSSDGTGMLYASDGDVLEEPLVRIALTCHDPPSNSLSAGGEANDV